MTQFQNPCRRLFGALLVTSVLGVAPASGSDPQLADPLPPPLSESETIHERIDVHAQRAIVRLSHGATFEDRATSRYLLRGVQYGVLGGIYKVDTQVPALRAQSLGQGWWTLLDGRPAGCMLEPAHEKPILIFSKTVAPQTDALAQALKTALDECGFRRLDVLVTRGGYPCTEAYVTISSEPVGVANDPPCRTYPSGLCRFYVPTAMYEFRVTCNSESTDPVGIYRAVAPGAGVQTEAFDFAGAPEPSTPPAPPPATPPGTTPPPGSPPGQTTPPPPPTTKGTPPSKTPPPATPPQATPPAYGRVPLGKLPPSTKGPPPTPSKLPRTRITRPPSRLRLPGRTATPPSEPPQPSEPPPTGTPPASVAVRDCPVTPVRGGPCWTTEDVINSAIDHHAQSALLRMFAGGGVPAAEASQILCAAKAGELEGVYLPDQQVPALRVRSQGGNWWEMIPAGSHSVCYQPPPDRAPLIAFSKQIKDDRALVAIALSNAWHDCKLPPTAPRCYVATISKPKPELVCPPGTIPDPEGEVCVPQVVCPPGSDPKPDGTGCVERECPPGTIPDGDLCILDLPGTVQTPCTQSEIEQQFQQKTDFCASIKFGLDAACGLGQSPCDHLRPVKFGCDVFERIFGKPIPGAKHPACSESNAGFYKRCVLSTLEGERKTLPCTLPSASDLRQKYDSWPGKQK